MQLYINIVADGTIYENTIEKHLLEELPFMATENILMYCVKKGGDRQKLRETIRQHSVAAAYEVKQNGKENDLIERILNDKEIGLTAEELKSIINAISFTGLATKQARDYSKYCRGIIGEIEDEMVEIKV